MAFRIAAHLCGWPKDVVQDRRRVMEIVQAAGYDGVEGFSAASADELVEVAALAAEYGLHLINVGAPDPGLKARFNATLGNDAAEVPAGRKPGHEPSDAELAALCQTLEPHLAAFAKLGVKPFHHIHVGCILETTTDCARVLKYLPGLWLLYDTGHLQAANCDPMEVLARYPQQIGHVHLKNFWTQDPQAGWDRHRPDFWKTSRFCDLAEGNCGFDVGACLRGLEQAGYQGWISVKRTTRGATSRRWSATTASSCAAWASEATSCATTSLERTRRRPGALKPSRRPRLQDATATSASASATGAAGRTRTTAACNASEEKGFARKHARGCRSSTAVASDSLL